MTEVVSSSDGCLPVKTLGGIQMSDERSIPHLQHQVGQGAGTNLYYNHSKIKHVRFPCSCVHSLENLWRVPSSGIFISLGCGVHCTIDRSELEIRQTSVAIAVDENIGLADGYQRSPK